MRRRTLASLVPLALSVAALGSLAGPAQAAVDNHIGLVSVASPESSGNGSYTQGISDDGRYVVFASHQLNLVPGDPGDVGRYVYLRDTVAGTTTRVTGGTDGYLMSNAAISGDGRYTVFANRTTSHGNASLRIFDRTTGVSKVISAPQAASPAEWYTVAISDNGRVVLYTRTTSTDDATWVSRLYRYDVNAGTTTQVLSQPVGGPPDRPNYATIPSLSSDGRVAVFSQAVTPGADTSAYQLVRLNLGTGARTVIGTSGQQYIPINAFGDATISNTGRFVAYTLPDANALPHAYLYDATTGASRLVSHDAAGQPNAGGAYQPQVSGDGAYVSFVGSGTGLVAGVPNVSTIYVWNRKADTTSAFVQNRQGVYPASSGAASSMPYIDGDGSAVAFTSTAQNLVAGTGSRLERAFVWTRP